MLNGHQALHRTGETFRLQSGAESDPSSRHNDLIKPSAKTARMDTSNLELLPRRKTWMKPRKDSGWPAPKGFTSDEDGASIASDEDDSECNEEKYASRKDSHSFALDREA